MVADIPFDALPLRKDGPPGNAWGRFGDDDQLGTLNFLTPETTKKAAQEITDGMRIPTDWPLGSMSTPCFNRDPLRHTFKHKAPRTINDDMLYFNTQSSSQWDGFRHFGYQKEEVYYNGMKQDEVLTTHRNGIDGECPSSLRLLPNYANDAHSAWVERGGIAGRGVLLDYAAWCDEKGEKPEIFAKTPIPVGTLQEIAAKQGVTFRRGDILLIRTGWIRAYQKLSEEGQVNLAALQHPPAIGLEASEETLRWIWDEGFAAAAGDQPSFEAWPCWGQEITLHERMLAGWGCPIGELFDLERLSEECKKRGRYTFFFTSMPLNVSVSSLRLKVIKLTDLIQVPGGVASPPNGMAIF